MAGGVDQNLTDLLNNAPELQQTPGLTLGMAQGLQGAPVDAGQVGQATSLALVSQGVSQAQQDVKSINPVAPSQPHHSGGIMHTIGGFFGHVAHDVNNDVVKPVAHDVLAPVGNVLNAGLNEVTHTYRYVHDVWQRHGVLAALGEMGIIAAGATAGVFFAPELLGAGLAVGILGGEVAGDLGGRMGYQDSWKATSNGGAYKDSSGYHVSPGRDLSRFIGAVTGAHIHPDAQGNLAGNGLLSATSGIEDATFDLSFDPALKAGALAKAARVGGVIIKGERGIKVGDSRILVGRTPKALVDPDGIRANDVQTIYRNNPAVNDAFHRIAGMDTKDVLTNFPSLAPMAKALGAANTGDEVANTFEKAFTARNYSFIQHGLPATSITRRAFPALPSAGRVNTALQSKFSRQALDENGNPLISSVTGMPVRIPKGPVGHTINAFTTYQPFAFNSRTLDISGHKGDPADPEFLRGLFSTLKYSQTADTAKAIMAKYIDADTLAEKVNIVGNAYRDALRASGLKDDDPFAVKVMGSLDFMNKEALSGATYGTERDGRRLLVLDRDGNQVSRGLTVNQTGELAFPDFNEWNRAIRDSKGGLWAKAGAADDFINRHITTKFFKRLVLLSLGFALRVSAGELIPASLSTDAKKVMAGGIAGAAAKLNPDLHEIMAAVPREEGDHPLIGARAITKGRTKVGVIKDFDAGAGEAHVAFPGEDPVGVPFKDLTVYHDDIADEEIRKVATDYGMSVSSDELPHIRAAAGKALWGVSKGFVDPAYREVALLNVMANGGHMVAPGLSSLHEMPRGFAGIHEDVRQAALQAHINIPKNYAMGKSFRLWDSGDQNHPLFWKFALGEQAADPGYREMARAYSDKIREGGSEHDATQAAIKADRAWMESSDPLAVKARGDMVGYHVDPDSYSAVRAEYMYAMTHGSNGVMQNDVISALSRGESPTIAQLAEKDIQNRPLAVKGRTLEPAPNLDVMSRGLAHVWGPIHGIINSLSRTPIWTMLVTDEYKAFKPWIDAGSMTKAEAHSIAQVRSLNRMLPMIHNPLLRNKFALATRNVMPFYFAQEQAYKRYGTALWASPKGFREAQLLMHGLHSSGSLQTDAQGNQHIVFPGVGDVPFLATLGLSHLGYNVLGGVPGSVSGDTISLRSVVPEMNGPSVSPLVAVPLKELAKTFPATDPFVRTVLGPVSFGSTMSQELIPNATLRRAWEALDASDKNRAFGSTMMANAAWAAHKALPLWQQAEAIDPKAMDPSIPRSEINPRAAALLAKADEYLPLPNADPSAKNRANDRMKNATRIQLLFKAAIGFVSPLSPSVAVGDVKLQPEFQAAIAKYGIAKGMQVFLDAHPDATPDTVFQSDNSATGTSPPSTHAALTWLADNRGWVGSNLLAASYLLPQTAGKFDNVAYNEELSMKLRQRRTPQQFVDAVYTAEGNAEFIPSLKAYEAQKQALSGDSTGLRQLSQQWQGYISDLKTRNPVWYDNEFSVTKGTVALQAYQQLQKAVADPKTPASPQTGIVRQLISDYQNYQQQVALTSAGGGQYSKSELKTQWQDYLDQFVSQHPEAQSVAYGVFRRLADN